MGNQGNTLKIPGNPGHFSSSCINCLGSGVIHVRSALVHEHQIFLLLQKSVRGVRRTKFSIKVSLIVAFYQKKQTGHGPRSFRVALLVQFWSIIFVVH